MLLPQDLITGVYKKPRVFLCETDKEIICPLETTNMSGVFKFNSYSTLSFNVARIYNDIITGEIKVNPFYDKIQSVRLVLLEGFGYFELQDPEIEGDGIKEVKSLEANSLEYTLSHKYLENLYVNTGKVDSVEVLYAADRNTDSITPVVFYKPENPELSLLHLILEKAYGWKIGHVDESLKDMRRKFEIDRESIYDFIMNEICKEFNCYVVFDTFNNTINFYAEALTNRRSGDGVTKTFTLSPVFSEIGTVSIDGYKTTNYTYNNVTGELVLGRAPSFGSIIEITDGSLSAWETDVYVSFSNLAQQMNISYSADDIKTVLTVKGANDLDVREVNNGLPYIVDLSYFYSPDWMGPELFDAYGEYLSKCNEWQTKYKANSLEILETANRISYETDRLSLQYSEVSVSDETVGTYYVRGGNADTGYYYSEVQLPDEYVSGTIYYSTRGSDLTEAKVSSLYNALKIYYNTGEVSGFVGDDSTLIDDFSFMEKNTLQNLIDTLRNEDISDNQKDATVLAFFEEMWEQIGLTPLNTLYFEPYKTVKTVNVNAGWSEKSNQNYGLYYPVVLLLQSIENAIKVKEEKIKELNIIIAGYSKNNALISEDLLMENNFTEKQMVRLSAFLREDEYTDDNFIETGNESTKELFQIKQELLECGHIELARICEPCLNFSMSLANIYALPEFAPIVKQFQLGYLIKVALRDDYVKHTRLMQVNLNFEDFSDFSCDFGDLSSTLSQSDLHADLLSQAVSAGKTVASNASYWEKGIETANSIDLRLQQGLLNAATEIKSIDGTQNSFIDKYGLHLQDIDPDTGEISPEQGWIVNNKFLYSDDAFKTTKSVFGKYTVDNQTYWGLIAEAVLAGYIEGSTIKGGTIQIGERADGHYNFEVDENGIVTFYGGKSMSSSGEEMDLDTYYTTIELTADTTVLKSDEQKITLECQIYSYDNNVTTSYDSTAFSWYRSTSDAVADEAWNKAQAAIAHGNKLTISSNDMIDGVAFFQCHVDLTSGGKKASNTVHITTGASDVNVFTSKPDNILADGYCYHIGDLWVIGSDYQPTYKDNGVPQSYSQHTILVSTVDSALYTDSDWVESVYYSSSFGGLQEWQGSMQQHVQIQNDGLHLIGTEGNGVSFEAVLDSKNLTFKSRTSGQESQDLIWLGVNDTNVKNLNVQNYVNIQQESGNEALPYMKLGEFIFKIEDNGSLSIM